MALNTRGSVDPRWPYHNRNVGRTLELAEIEIFKDSNDSRVYDPATNTWTGAAVITYTGRARIQQKNSATDSSTSNVFNPTTIQNVDMFISYGRNTLTGTDGVVPDLRPNDKVRVTSCEYDPNLVNFLFVITGVVNSSNAWEKHFICRVDAEIDPTETV